MSNSGDEMEYLEYLAEKMYNASRHYWEHICPPGEYNGEGNPDWECLTDTERNDYLVQLNTVLNELIKLGLLPDEI